MSIIKPYNEDWARLLDFITPLNIQRRIDSNLELNFYKGEVSVSMQKLTGQLKPQIHTTLGVSIKEDHISRRKTTIEFGTLNNIQTRLTQKELMQTIEENTPLETVPAVIGKQRAILEPVKGKMQNLKALDGCDQVYRFEKSYGHFADVIRRRTMLPIANPCSLIRNDLVMNTDIKYNDPIFRRMRSIWRTEWMMATPRMGYSDLGMQGITDISIALSENKFHQDLGIPQEITGTLDSISIKEQIYRLLKRGELIAIG